MDDQPYWFIDHDDIRVLMENLDWNRLPNPLRLWDGFRWCGSNRLTKTDCC